MSKIDVISAREWVDVETLIEKLRTESLYKDKATLEIMDLCMAAADALERLNDFQNSQCAKLLADITTLHNTVAIAQREAAQAQKDMGRHKAHSEAISALPDCNTCGIHKDCTVKPRPGEWVRINCHLWSGMEVEG